MPALLLAILLQSTTISGGLAAPAGMPAPAAAQIVLLPLEYEKLYNAEVQQRLDDYWETYKPQFARQKELFFQVIPVAHKNALELVVSRMRRDNKINSSSLIKTASNGEFEFRGVLPGEYKLVAIGSIRGKDYVWMETLQVTSTPVFIQMKNRVP